MTETTEPKFVSWYWWWREQKDRTALVFDVGAWKVRYEFNTYVGVNLCNNGLLTFHDGVRSLEFYVNMYSESVGVPVGFMLMSNGKSVRYGALYDADDRLDVFKLAVMELANKMLDVANHQREHLQHRNMWKTPEPIQRELHVEHPNGDYIVNLNVIEMLGVREGVPGSEMAAFLDSLTAEAASCADSQ